MKILKLNPQVYDDLKAIKEYIAEDNPNMAAKAVDKILSDMERLKLFPESGTKLSNKVTQKTKYRYIISYSYATLYYIDKDAVIVSNVIHLSRDFEALKLDK